MNSVRFQPLYPSYGAQVEPKKSSAKTQVLLSNASRITPAFGNSETHSNTSTSEPNIFQRIYQGIHNFFITSLKKLFEFLALFFDNGTRATLEKDLKATEETLAHKDQEIRVANDLLNNVPFEIKSNIQNFKEKQAQRIKTLRKELSVYQQESHQPVNQGNAEKSAREGTSIPLPPKNEHSSDASPDITSLITPQLMDEALQGNNFQLEIPGEVPTVNRSEKSFLDLNVQETKSSLNTLEETEFNSTHPLQWNQEKCVQQMLQHFSETQNGTLSGIQFNINKGKDKTYTLRIKGDAELESKTLKSLDPTDSTKIEGKDTKLFSLNLFLNGWAETIEFSSRNWKKSFSIQENLESENAIKKLTQKLVAQNDEAGNYLEIKTKDESLVKALIKGIDYFSHPQNPDFNQPTFENDQFGFKFHGLDKTGNLYLANQRVEYASPLNEQPQWENSTEHITLWTKPGEKIEEKIETEINPLELRNVLLDPQILDALNDEELIELIFKLEPLWHTKKVMQGLEKIKSSQTDASPDSPNSLDTEQSTGRVLLNALLTLASNRSLTTDFSSYNEKYLADNLSKENNQSKALLQKEGYTLVPESFKDMGMVTAKDYLKELSKQSILAPSENDIIKMNILRDVAKLYLEAQTTETADTAIAIKELKEIRERVNQPIYLFDTNKAPHNKGMVQEEGEPSLWLSQEHLKTADFDTIIGNYLQELTPTNSENTQTYLTPWVTLIQRSLAKDLSRWQQLQDLRHLWNHSETRL